jgi:hypothetical protein
MFTRLLIIFIIGISVIHLSCQNDNLVLPYPCTEGADLPFTKVRISLISDVTSNDTINVDSRGYIYADNVKVQSNSFYETARIGGHICKDKRFIIDVIFYDVNDNSRLRIEGQQQPNNIISGTISYCDNLNNSCTFIQIGSIDGFQAEYIGGGFNTPLVSGTYRIYPF